MSELRVLVSEDIRINIRAVGKDNHSTLSHLSCSYEDFAVFVGQYCLCLLSIDNNSSWDSENRHLLDPIQDVCRPAFHVGELLQIKTDLFDVAPTCVRQLWNNKRYYFKCQQVIKPQARSQPARWGGSELGWVEHQAHPPPPWTLSAWRHQFEKRPHSWTFTSTPPPLDIARVTSSTYSKGRVEQNCWRVEQNC